MLPQLGPFLFDTRPRLKETSHSILLFFSCVAERRVEELEHTRSQSRPGTALGFEFAIPSTACHLGSPADVLANLFGRPALGRSATTVSKSADRGKSASQPQLAPSSSRRGRLTFRKGESMVPLSTTTSSLSRSRFAHRTGLRSAFTILVLACATTTVWASSPIPAGFNEVSVLGSDSVLLKKDGVVVSGDVIGNLPGAEVTISMAALTPASFEVKSDKITVKNGAVPAGTYFCNTLSDASGTASCTPLSLPVYAILPDFQTATANTNHKSVPNNGALTLAPGSYGNLAVGKNAILTLTGGVYDFATVTTGNGAKIRVQSLSSIRVAGGIHTGHDNVIGAVAPATAPDVVFYVTGSDSSSSERVHLAKGANVSATVYAPDGTIILKNNSTLTGAMIGRNVVIEGTSFVHLATAFRNLPPVAVGEAITVLEGGSATTLVGGATSLLANDSDPNNDGLFVTTTAVSAPTNGIVVLNADGTFTYTHDGSETTVDSFVYEVCDDGVAPGPLCSNATVSISITPVNDPPVANPDTLTVDEGGTATLLDGGITSVLANDTDAENNNLTVTTTPASGPSNGTLTLNGDGTFSYTHDGSETLSDTFDYEVCDDGTDTPGPLCSMGTVSITINPINDDPVADPQTLTVQTVTVVTLTGSDVDSPSLAFTILASPTFGSLSTVASTGPFSADVTYTPPSGPDADQNFDSFVFQVDDGSGGLANAVVSINLIPNQPPVALPDTILLSAGATATTLINGSSSLLANDSDPENQTLSLTTTPVSGPTNGSLTLVADGSFSYTHSGNGSFSDAFVYEVCDNGTPQRCANGDVSIRIALTSVDVTLTFLGTGGGSVTSDPAGLSCAADCTATVSASDRITLLASADAGSVFAGFGGDTDCNDGELVPDGNKSCEVTFDLLPPPPTGTFLLDVFSAGTGGGTVLTDPAGIDCGTTCSATFPAFARIELIAIPDLGSVFVNWVGTTDCEDGELSRLPNDDATCTAVFDLEPPPSTTQTLTVIVNGEGLVSTSPAGIVCASFDTCSADFPESSVVTLFARPSAGTFAGWTGDAACAGTSPILEVTLDAATTCTANFTP